METVFEFLGSVDLLSMGLQSWGLLLDGIGFILVFTYGGFSYGRSVLLSEDSREYPAMKWVGAIMVVLGFFLQFIASIQ